MTSPLRISLHLVSRGRSCSPLYSLSTSRRMQGPSQPTSNRKRLDPRIQSLIKNCVKTNHRSFFIVLGDKAVDQVVNLHFLLSQSRHTARPNVLWCYKKELGFTSNRKKREQKIKREVKKGHREVGDMDPFELFVSLTDIRYTYVFLDHPFTKSSSLIKMTQD